MFVLSYMYFTFWNFRHRLVRLYVIITRVTSLASLCWNPCRDYSPPPTVEIPRHAVMRGPYALKRAGQRFPSTGWGATYPNEIWCIDPIRPISTLMGFHGRKKPSELLSKAKMHCIQFHETPGFCSKASHFMDLILSTKPISSPIRQTNNQGCCHLVGFSICEKRRSQRNTKQLRFLTLTWIHTKASSLATISDSQNALFRMRGGGWGVLEGWFPEILFRISLSSGEKPNDTWILGMFSLRIYWGISTMPQNSWTQKMDLGRFF